MNSTVIKSFQILDYIADKQGQVRLTDLVRDLYMNKTTAFRCLETLEFLNMVEKKGQTYYLGLGLLQLGNKVHTQKLIIEKIHDIIERTAQGVNETVNLAVLHESRALYLHKAESQRRVQFRAQLGDKLPLHCTALGKSILSILPDEKREQLISKIHFDPMTKKTIRNADALKLQIEESRAKGYTEECEEVEDGLVCIAIPLHIPNLEFYGAISMSGALFRFTEERRYFLGKTLNLMLNEIKEALKDLY
ncbi:IclR family transcriptional regulator [bacterium]|nr:IclR family transcriptional regulator [bacterium]